MTIALPQAAPPRRIVVPVLGVTQILAWGSTYYLPAVLAAPIAADTGWPLSRVAVGLSVGLVAAGFVSPRVGRLLQRHGGRWVLSASALLMAAGLAILGLAASLPVFLAGWVVIGCGMGAGLYDAAFGTLARYYGERARQTITTLTLFGGFASTVCWPLSAALVEAVGWRGACLVYAGIQLAVCLPLLSALLPAVRRDAPGRSAPAAEGRIADLRGARRLAFLLLAVIVPAAGAVQTLLSVHLLTMLQERGLALAAAVSLGALIGPSQVGARFLEMLTGGRLAPIATLTLAGALIAAGVAILAAGWPALVLALILYGAGNGIWSIARGTLPLALFGPGLYPIVMGAIALPNLIAQAVSPLAGALLLERTGAGSLLAILAGAAVANLLLILLLGRVTRDCARAP
jgi:predicted MFS family arabinose efflux permease